MERVGEVSRFFVSHLFHTKEKRRKSRKVENVMGKTEVVVQSVIVTAPTAMTLNLVLIPTLDHTSKHMHIPTTH